MEIQSQIDITQKLYATPSLRELGTVQMMTQGSGGTMRDGGLSNSRGMMGMMEMMEMMAMMAMR